MVKVRSVVKDVQKMVSIIVDEIRAYCRDKCRNSIGYEPCITTNCNLIIALYWAENALNTLEKHTIKGEQLDC